MPSRNPSQLAPGAWRHDPVLVSCSFGARALWREMRDLMRVAEPIGHLASGGEPLTPEALAYFVGAPVAQVARWLRELERRRVFSRTADGTTIISTRLIREAELNARRAAGGKLAQNNPNVPRSKDTLGGILGRIPPKVSSDGILAGGFGGGLPLADVEAYEESSTSSTTALVVVATSAPLPATRSLTIGRKREKRVVQTSTGVGTPQPVYSPEFTAAWTVYPERPNNPKRAAWNAWNARLAVGVSPAELFAGVERYRTYCDATGRTATEFTLQASTFFGPGDRWADPWRVGPAERSAAGLGGRYNAGVATHRNALDALGIDGEDR